MELHQKIRKLRKNKKWYQADLAKKLGVHTTHISRLEGGEYSPSLKIIKKISEIFEVSTDYLLKDKNDSYEVNIRDKGLAERIKLIDNLKKEEREALVTVIDAMLTKQKVLELLTRGNILQISG